MDNRGFTNYNSGQLGSQTTNDFTSRQGPNGFPGFPSSGEGAVQGAAGSLGVNGLLGVGGLGSSSNFTAGIPSGQDSVNSDTYASDTMAAIARQDFQRYQQYFQPLEGILGGMVNNNAYNVKQVNTASSNFTNQFQANQGNYQRDLSRYGLSMSPDQMKSYSRLQSESGALGKVNAINTTDRAIGDNEMNILFGSGGAPTNSLLQQLPANALAK